MRLASPHTISNYRRDLKRFAEFYAHQSGQSEAELKLTHIERTTIQDWLVSSHTQGLAAASLGRRLSAIKSLFTFAVRNHHCTDNPAIGIRAPKLGKRLPKTLPPEQTQQLLSTTQRTFDARELALLALLYGCGLRVSEVVGVDLDHLYLNHRQLQGEVKVRGKGNKERIVPLPELAVTLIQDWLAARSQFKPDHQALFLNRFGQRLSVRSVQRMLKDRALETGADASVTPHKLRHSFATDMLAGGANLRSIQTLLGHASLATTEHYTHVTLPQLQQTYHDAHPRSTLNKAGKPS